MIGDLDSQLRATFDGRKYDPESQLCDDVQSETSCEAECNTVAHNSTLISDGIGLQLDDMLG